MNQVELARVSHDGYVLEFPRRFVWFGLGFTLFGLVLFGFLVYEWLTVESWRDIAIDQWLLVRAFSLPFGLGLLVWSTQKVAVVQDRIAAHHLGRVRQLDRSSAFVHKTIKGGTYIKDAGGKKLFLSNWLVNQPKLLQEIARR